MENSLDAIQRDALFRGTSPFEEEGEPLTCVPAFKCLPNEAASISLNGLYEMTAGGDTVPDFSDSIPANVPCTVQTALLEAGKIPDPLVAKNDRFAREAAYNIWWFKKEFEYDGSLINPRLCFSGVCYQASFYLNGVCLGEHAGMFGGPEYAVGDLLQERNTLLVKIENAPADLQQYSDIADHDEGWKNGVVVNCVYGWHYACIPSRGIWMDVALKSTPGCVFERPFIATEDYKCGKMGVSVKAFGEGSGKLRVRVSPENFQGETQCFDTDFSCRSGERLHYTLMLREPRLWWPNGYGEQPLYRFEISIEMPGDLVQTFEETVGIRQVEMCPIDDTPRPDWYNWRFFINGKYIFIKGTNWCTVDALLRCTEDRYDRLLSLAKHQNLQLLRAWGGGLPETEYFYRKCDELGLMVQQEWPTCWESPAVQPSDILIETARIHTVRLRNHPCLVRWAGGNELTEAEHPVIGEMAKVSYELDGTRPFHRTSPYAGSLHNYDTYWMMEPMDHALNLRAPFIGEFGMASAPNYESVARYVPAEELDDPIERTRKNSFNYHTPRFNEYLWPEPYNDMDHLLKRSQEFVPMTSLSNFILGTQLAQATAVRHTLEAQRADSPKAAGVCYYKINDVYPACSWATVDYYGVPKIPYYVFQDAFAPLHGMLTIRSIDTAAEYPVTLLDDACAVTGKECLIRVSAYDGALHLVKEEEVSVVPAGAVQPAGVFSLSESERERTRVLTVRLYVNGALVDDTFYLQSYRIEPKLIETMPAAALALSVEENFAVITNTSAVPAVGVFLECLPHDTRFTAARNFLFLKPGETRRIAVSHTDGLSVRAINGDRVGG